jgi:hypothetical protein
MDLQYQYSQNPLIFNPFFKPSQNATGAGGMLKAIAANISRATNITSMLSIDNNKRQG